MLEMMRMAWRTHRRQKGFAALAIVTFALTVALNTTIYAVLDAMLEPRVAIDHPEQLVLPHYYDIPMRLKWNALHDALRTASPKSFEDVTDLSWGTSGSIEFGRNYRDGSVMGVRANFFRILRARPTLGRLLGPADEHSSTTGVVISERLRHALFPNGGNPLGQIISLVGEPAMIIGVIDNRSRFPDRVDAWRIAPGTSDATYFGTTVGRLRDGASMAEAMRDMEVIRRRIAAAEGIPAANSRIELRRVFDRGFAVQSLHLALVGAVLAVLLVAALNIASLQIARGLGRRRELATRSALGASRRALVTQLLAETGALIACGLVLGLTLSCWAMSLVAATVPASLADSLVAPQWSWRVLVASACAATLALAIAGLLPSIRVSRFDLGDVLRSSPGAGNTRKHRQQAGLLVAAQVALALCLCIACTLALRAALVADLFKPGFETGHLVDAGFPLGPSARGRPTPLVTHANDLVAKLRSLPAVVDAGVRYRNGWLTDQAVAIDDPGGGRREIPLGIFSTYSVVTPGYFRTMGLRPTRGRDFVEGGEPEPVAIVNDVAARQWWPLLADPTGRLLKLGSTHSDAPWVRVVGVFRHDDRWPGSQDEARPSITVSYAGDTTAAGRFGASLVTLVRVRGNAAEAATTVRRVSTDSPDPRRRPFADTWERSMGLDGWRARQTFISALFLTFALLALGLAALGVYAVTAHAVSQRTREFGVRIALGARPTDILISVLREGNLLGLAGVAGGLLLARWTVGTMSAFLVGMEVFEPLLFAGVALVLLAIVVLACAPSALRAASVDPVESLRSL